MSIPTLGVGSVSQVVSRRNAGEVEVQPTNTPNGLLTIYKPLCCGVSIQQCKVCLNEVYLSDDAALRAV